MDDSLTLQTDIRGFLRNTWVVNGLVAAGFIGAALFFHYPFLYVGLILPAFYIARGYRMMRGMPRSCILDADGVTVFWEDGRNRRFERTACDIRSEVTVLRGIEECSLVITPHATQTAIRLPLAEERLADVQRMLGEIPPPE